MYLQNPKTAADPSTGIVYIDTSVYIDEGYDPWHLPFLGQMPGKTFQDYEDRYYFNDKIKDGKKDDVPVYVLDSGLQLNFPVGAEWFRRNPLRTEMANCARMNSINTRLEMVHRQSGSFTSEKISTK